MRIALMLRLRLGQLLDPHKDKIISAHSIVIPLLPVRDSSKVPLLDLKR